MWEDVERENGKMGVWKMWRGECGKWEVWEDGSVEDVERRVWEDGSVGRWECGRCGGECGKMGVWKGERGTHSLVGDKGFPSGYVLKMEDRTLG